MKCVFNGLKHLTVCRAGGLVLACLLAIAGCDMPNKVLFKNRANGVISIHAAWSYAKGKDSFEKESPISARLSTGETAEMDAMSMGDTLDLTVDGAAHLKNSWTLDQFPEKMRRDPLGGQIAIIDIFPDRTVLGNEDVFRKELNLALLLAGLFCIGGPVLLALLWVKVPSSAKKHSGNAS